jgi:hypothetical protein
MHFRFVTVPERGVSQILSAARDRLTIFLILRDERGDEAGISAGMRRPGFYPPKLLSRPSASPGGLRV